MIKPSNLDLSTPLKALTSYEKSRFAGLDLEASTKEPVVLEEHEDYDLVQIELAATNGKPIFRKIKAYKNGETVEVPPEEEVPPPPALVSVAITGPAKAKIGVATQYAVTHTPAEAVAKVTKWTTTSGTITNAGELTANKLGAGTVTVDVDGKKKTFNITVENKGTLTVAGNPPTADAPFSVTVGSNSDQLPASLTVAFDKVGLVGTPVGTDKVDFTFAEAYQGTEEIEVTISAPDFTAVKFKVLVDASVGI